MTYTRIAGDEEYRAVSLANSIVPKFTPFRNDGQTINYVGDTVLEIKRTDGSTSLIYDNGSNQKRKVAVRRSGNQIIVAGGIPTARMWLRDEATGIEYKLPVKLPQNQEGNTYFQIMNMSGSVKLIGDKYFDMVYDTDPRRCMAH